MVPPVNRLSRRLAVAIAAAGLCCVAVPSTGLGASPLLGSYAGTSTTNAPGNGPQGFHMTISRGKCAAPGSRVRHTAYCTAVSAVSIVQAPCPAEEFVNDAFFPVNEPVALSGSLKISHTYTLYSNGGQLEDHPVAGGKPVGSFQYSLSVTTHGNASGKMHLIVGGCDSGALTISARRKHH
jgi:hypothetical protein